MTKTLKQKMNRKGFTLIELIVVIAIIAILAAVLIPRFAGFTKSADKSAAQATARTISTALATLVADGRYTATQIEAFDEGDTEITDLTGTLPTGATITAISVTGNSIDFTYTSDKDWVVVYSDGKEASVTYTP
ncbi:hypothetical protein SDC9_50862 [bioreactor metagenome]|uniref:Type II secretion system protein G n=1 Tax=bioreactor metagenome TaxID=1076179 RepID=A0A644WQQ8_9ZZZZ